MSTESEEVQYLFDRIAACKQRAIALHATGYRFADTRYANESDLISGEGAGVYGARWNPPGLNAVYAALDPVTAVQESYQNFQGFGFFPKPRVLAGLAIRLRHMLDLTDSRIRRFLGFTVADLVGEDWSGIQQAGEESWTQAIGRGAARAGFEGLLVPSARHAPGRNVVIFPQKLRVGSSVAAIAPEELPPPPGRWRGPHA
jgi:RES domain-containing protein